MPSGKHVEVLALDEHGYRYGEYETINIQERAGSGRLITCYFKSGPGKQLRFLVSAKMPFPDIQLKTPSNELKKNDGNNDFKRLFDAAPASLKPILLHHDRTAFPYDLLVSVHFDGSEVPARSTVILLDHTHPFYEDMRAENYGRRIIEGQRTQGADGSTLTQPWIFREVDVDMDLSGIDERISMLTLDTGNAPASKVGQVDVVVRRIVMKPPFANMTGHPAPAPGMQTSASVGQLFATLGDAYPGGPTTSHAAEFHPFDANEGSYVHFRFFYRSENVLNSMNLSRHPNDQYRCLTRVVAPSHLAGVPEGQGELEDDSMLDLSPIGPTAAANVSNDTMMGYQEVHDQGMSFEFEDEDGEMEEEPEDAATSGMLMYD